MNGNRKFLIVPLLLIFLSLSILPYLCSATQSIMVRTSRTSYANEPNHSHQQHSPCSNNKTACQTGYHCCNSFAAITVSYSFILSFHFLTLAEILFIPSLVINK